MTAVTNHNIPWNSRKLQTGGTVRFSRSKLLHDIVSRRVILNFLLFHFSLLLPNFLRPLLNVISILDSFITLYFTAGLTNIPYNFKYVDLLQDPSHFIKYLGYVFNDWLSASCLYLLHVWHI